MARGFRLGLMGAALALLAASPAMAAGSCEALKDFKSPNLRITLAQTVTPNPSWPYPPSVFNAAAGPNARVMGAPFCRVAGVIETEIAFEVWLPSNWNGRFLGVGNGGLVGALNYPSMGQGLAKGFAVASTDTGHKNVGDSFFETEWMVGRPDRVINFGHRAQHLMAETSKRIVAAFYGRDARFSYFNGCSTGGRQAFMEVQKYPADYDGVLAGAPASNSMKLQTRGIWLDVLTRGEPAGALNEARQKLLVGAALARCDAQDGVRDGVMDPSRCDFDPAQLQCPVSETDSCLTAAQVKRARLLYGPLKSPKGMSLYPGNAYGAPISDGGLPGAPATATPSILIQAPESKWTVASFDPDRDLPVLERDHGVSMSAYDPDLSAFKVRGGKVIMYHGWADPLLSPYNSIAYFESVQAKMGPSDSFLRLFMIPGMGHCAGGPGTDTFDGFAAIQAWVEQGKAPDVIQASHMSRGAADRTRPLCPYPQVARYMGSGSTDDAANFSCARP